jgi:hypothetical protein
MKKFINIAVMICIGIFILFPLFSVIYDPKEVIKHAPWSISLLTSMFILGIILLITLIVQLDKIKKNNLRNTVLKTASRVNIKSLVRIFLETEPEKSVSPISLADYQITNIVVEEFPTIFVLYIVTEKPGLIIGVRGERIDRLKKYLEEILIKSLGKSIDIRLKESRIWR